MAGLGWHVALAVLTAVLLGAGASSAFAQTITVPPTTQPLPASQFQGGDGDQDNPSPDPNMWIDWQGLQVDGRVSHTSDPQTNDNVFTGGSKELEPDRWGITTEPGGATPGKTNVLDIYRALDHPPSGQVFLYLAFTRFKGDGQAFVTFELNQDARLWTNSSGASIPCRTTGDLLISFDDNSNGNGAEVEIDRWVTDASDASSGCATRGHLVPASGLTPNVDVQASFNYSSPINNYLPGFLPLGTGTIPTVQFGETAVNLTSALGDLGNPCGVFHSTWMHSRSSLSDTSEMQDYVAPQRFAVATCPAAPALSTTASGSVHRTKYRKQRMPRRQKLGAPAPIFDVAHISGVDPTGTITFNLYGPDDASCTRPPVFTSSSTVLGNGDYQSGSFTPTTAGTYRWVAVYSGDDNNLKTATKCGDPAETIVISPASPSLSTTASGPTRKLARRSPRRPHKPHVVHLHTARADQPIYDTATLQNGFNPTGTITFRLYGPDDSGCSGTPTFTSTVPVSGNGTYTSEPFTPTRAGIYRWVADYSGDHNNSSAGPTACAEANETTVISPAQPKVVTVASGAVTVGSPISDSATLSDGAHPTGTITFKVYGPGDSSCTGSPADTSTVTVTGNRTYMSNAFTPSAAGTYRWIATYSGDDDNDGAATSCNDEGESVVVAHPVVQPALTTTASSPAPVGSAIRDTAHLSDGATPTGTITFEVFGPNDTSCAQPPAASSTVAVDGNGDYMSDAFTPTEVGTYRWVTYYSGDDSNHPAATTCSDTAETVTASKAQPSMRTLASHGVVGRSIHDSAILTDGSNPTGKITFQLYPAGDSVCSDTPVFSAEETVVGNGFYRSPSFRPAHAGTYQWIATYSGDHNNQSATTGCGDEPAVVLPHQPLLATSASPTPPTGKGRRARSAGLSIYDSATLRFGFSPTGGITFALYGPSDPTCTRTPVFVNATTVTGNGVYDSERYTPTASGTYRWVAVYSGDANNLAAGPTRCDDAAEQVTVTLPAQPQLVTSASASVTLGAAVDDTAYLSGGSNPAGTITFKLHGPSDPSCTAPPVFTSTVSVSGNGSYTSESFVPVQPGPYRWVASYSGDPANHGAGPTGCGDPGESVTARPPSITPVVPTLSTAVSPPPEPGGTLYDTATLAGGADPGGTITFTLYGPNDTSCSAAPVFATTAPVSGNGTYRSAAFDVPIPGSYRWVATYSGDAMNTAAGPTTCGDAAESVDVATAPGPNPDVGGITVTRPKTRPAKPRPKSPRRRRRAGFTG